MDEEVKRRNVDNLKFLSYTRVNGVARVGLNRPPFNVMSIAMLEEISTVLDAIEVAGDVQVVVLSGSEKAFSGGLDLSDHTEERSYQLIESFNEVFRKLEKLEPPTISVVKGMALGGGCELAASCDLAFVAEDAKLGQPEIKVGVFPPIAAIVYPQLIGRHRTMELIFSGEVFSGKEAAEMGLVNRALPATQVDAEAEKWVERLSALSAPVLQLTRRAVTEAAGLPFADALRKVEEIYLNYLLATEDAREGLRAFLEKRKPSWKNR